MATKCVCFKPNAFVTIQKPSVGTRDATTGAIVPEPFAPAFQCWAEIRPMKGRELQEARAVSAQTPYNFRIRWSRQADLVTPRHRIKADPPRMGPAIRYFNIVDVGREDEEKDYVIGTCIEQTE